MNRLELTPGVGIVARSGPKVAFLATNPNDASAIGLLGQLVAVGSWEEMAKAAAAHIAGTGFRHAPLICAFIGSESISVLCHGDVPVSISAPDVDDSINAADVRTWREHHWPSDDATMTVGVFDPARAGWMTDGLAFAGGFRLSSSSPGERRDAVSALASRPKQKDVPLPTRPPSESAPTIEPFQSPDPASAASEAGDQVEAVNDGQPPPAVQGVRCPAGHLTSMADDVCRTCGAAIEPNADVVTGRRPALGRLVLGDGTIVPLVRTTIIGANLDDNPLVSDTAAERVELGGRIEDGTLIEVRLIKWSIELKVLSCPLGLSFFPNGLDGPQVKLREGSTSALTGGASFQIETEVVHFDTGQAP